VGSRDRLAIGVREGVIESAVDDRSRHLGRWDTVVGMNGLLWVNLCILDSLYYAVDSLVTILLGSPVLLDFL
jgi:hypothetical protein